MKRTTAFIILVAICVIGFAQENKNKIRLTEGWEFLQGDIGSTYEAFRSEKLSKLPNWKKVNMPHCFNEFDAVDPDVAFYQGPGWYKNYLEIDNPYTEGRTVLHFEGAGQKTEVYVYQTLVGAHVGGYDEFTIDLTKAVAEYKKEFPEAKKVPIAIRCDNTRDVEMIPSDLSDFNVYGGLYRYVNLVYLPPVSFKHVWFDYELDSKMKKAEVTLSSELVNHAGNQELEIKHTISDANGAVVAAFETTENAWEGKKSFPSIKLKKINLWHPDSPYLYTLESTVTFRGAQYKLTEKVGFIKFEFIKKGPFHLNGERLLLRGTHRHEDHAGVAQAMPEHLIRQEMILMKEMGVNFIRLGHYQQSRIVLDLCDSLGILVWEEIPWCRGGLGGPVYKEQARRMLRNMINQHYNKTSIILWGLGNENDWPGDFDEFDEKKIQDFMSELNDISHSMDNKRKTCIRRCEFCKHIVDVYSPSIWAGWYRGKYINYKEVSHREAMTVDHFLHVEWGASNHAGRHSENPDVGLEQIRSLDADERDGDFLMTGGAARVSKDGDWSETYACNLIDWHLKEQENMDWLTGTAYWPFKDFSTPLRPENPVPYVNQKGVVQRDLRPKEAFYLFKSYWTKDPMVHIYGHSWPVRWGKAEDKKMLKVYSNCSEAELFLNGKSLGKKKRNSQDFPAAGLRWRTALKVGENIVKVKGYEGKEVVEDEITFTYQLEGWGKPTELKISEVSREGDVLTLEAKIYDKDGTFCPDARNRVAFEVAGDAELLDNLGTSDGSRKIQLYNGRAQIKLKLTGKKAYASVESQGVLTGFLELAK